MTPEQALARIVRHHLDRAERNYDGALRGEDPEHLHDLRVAIRRIRFALRLFAPFVDEKRCRQLRDALEAFNDRSGDVRDLDVSMARLEKLVAKKRVDAGTGKKIFGELSRRYAQSRSHMIRALTSSRYTVAIEKIRRYAAELEEAGMRKRAKADAAKTFDRLTKEHVATLASWGTWNARKLSTKDLHKMRIDFKRARYLMEFAVLCGLDHKDAKRKIALYKSLQDMLGKHRDAVTLTKEIKKIAKDACLHERSIENIIRQEKKRAKKNMKRFVQGQRSAV